MILRYNPDIYDKAIALLQQIKLTQGNTALNSTLRRHSKLKKFLLEVQVSRLDSIENAIDNS